LSQARKTLASDAGAGAAGPYSPAVAFGDLLFCSGQIPVDPGTGELVGSSAAEQTRQCLHNLELVCDAAGAQLSDALRLTVYMTDIAAAPEINEAYAAFFDGDLPARAAVEVGGLPRQSLVEIDAIVALPSRV
jgi:2-iminobutanoate/2-iminopropanoate deaminase